MMKRTLQAALFLCFFGPALVSATEPYPVQPYPFPYRSVATSFDFSAVRFNPAGLGRSSDVEFAWHHKVSGSPTGFNAASLRAKGLGFSVSWLDDATYGKRREYLIAAGTNLSAMVGLGATFRWLKADDPTLQNSTTWTLGAMVTPAPAFSAGARWENVLKGKVGGVSTWGQWVLGVSSRPMGPKTEFAVDWVYPGWAKLSDTDLRWSVRYQPATGLNVRGFVDTQQRVGLELEFAVERSKAGAESRFNDYSKYQDGTLYLTVLNHDYTEAKKRPVQ